MNNIDTLNLFVKHCIKKERQTRYLSLIESDKGKLIFISLLNHDVYNDLNKSVYDKNDFKANNSDGCYVYHCQYDFGTLITSFKAAYNELSLIDSWLIISTDGRYVAYRPESTWDKEIKLILKVINQSKH